jgi:hypothetical protein
MVEETKKLEDTNVLIPWYPISYLTIASSGFYFFGRLRVPTRRCDLVVPADGGWGRSNKDGTIILVGTYLTQFRLVHQKGGGTLRGLRIKRVCRWYFNPPQASVIV